MQSALQQVGSPVDASQADQRQRVEPSLLLPGLVGLSQNAEELIDFAQHDRTDGFIQKMQCRDKTVQAPASFANKQGLHDRL